MIVRRSSPVTAKRKTVPDSSRRASPDYAIPNKSASETAMDREDAKSAARALRDLKAGSFDGISLDELEARIRSSD
jgi:hypothetical protein